MKYVDIRFLNRRHLNYQKELYRQDGYYIALLCSYRARPLLKVATMLPTASLLSLGLPGLSKFLIFSGESELTLTLALAFLTTCSPAISVLATLRVLRVELGEWKS